MKYVIYRPYWNFEKEEQWLNSMSAKGLALTDYSWCRYVFEECNKSEFTYRIELLEHRLRHPESVAYIHFLEETGIEHVASYMKWGYFRKKTEDGPFDIYSDIDSRINHYKRVNRIWIVMAALELIVGIANIAISIVSFMESNVILSNFFGGLIVTVLGVFFASMVISFHNKIKFLKREKEIRE